MKACGRVRVWALVVLLGCAGCRSSDLDPGALEVLRGEDTTPPAEPPPERYRLLASSEAIPRGRSPLDLWLPLPTTTPEQTVQALVFEVGPPGVYAMEVTPEGDRALHVHAADGHLSPVRVRAEVDRYVGEPEPWPAGLPRPRPGQEPQAWIREASGGAWSARLVHGLALTDDGRTVRRRWPEVTRVDEAQDERTWRPVDLEQVRLGLAARCVRLGTLAPRAEANGEQVEVRTTYSLER